VFKDEGPTCNQHLPSISISGKSSRAKAYETRIRFTTITTLEIFRDRIYDVLCVYISATRMLDAARTRFRYVSQAVSLRYINDVFGMKDDLELSSENR
jgi:hypothetical protein